MYCVIPLTLGAPSSDSREQKVAGGYQGLGEGGMRTQCLIGAETHFYKMRRVLETDGGDVVQHWEGTTVCSL